MVYLSVAAAKVNHEARQVVSFLRTLPSEMLNIEVQRFMEHLTSDKVAITGMRFFALTKSLILKVKFCFI